MRPRVRESVNTMVEGLLSSGCLGGRDRGGQARAIGRRPTAPKEEQGTPVRSGPLYGMGAMCLLSTPLDGRQPQSWSIRSTSSSSELTTIASVPGGSSPM